MAATPGKLRVEDLIDLMEREESVEPLSKSALKKKLDSLHKTHRSLAVPLSDSKRARVERRAAYQIVSEDVRKWDETVALNAKAPHLDLTEPRDSAITLQSITKQETRSSLQEKVQAVLEQNDLLPKDQPEEDEIVDSTAARAQARSDLFHRYLKQKHTAKIKSKLYHKLRKAKNEPLSEEAQQEQDELQRVQERINQRHSSAKQLKKSLKFAKREHDYRNEVLAANDQLRQRIRNPSRINSDGKVTFESSSSEEELDQELEEPTGVMAMRFMREAVKRDREEQGRKDDFEEAEQDKAQVGKLSFSGKKQDIPSETRKSSVRQAGVEPPLVKKQRSERQEALIDQAFNLDEMDQVAAEEWQKEATEQAEKQPKVLNGWGSWYGLNTPKQAPLPEVPKIPCERVVRNTSRIKAAAKYLVKKLPFPYSSTQQFDAAHKLPIGKDWNTQRAHQKIITPEVTTRPGQIIQPIRKPDEE